MRQADKQQPITMGKVVKILRPNFDDHEPLFPRIRQDGREGYLGSGAGISKKDLTEIDGLLSRIFYTLNRKI